MKFKFLFVVLFLCSCSSTNISFILTDQYKNGSWWTVKYEPQDKPVKIFINNKRITNLDNNWSNGLVTIPDYNNEFYNQKLIIKK